MTAEELLARASGVPEALTIDNDLRTITIPSTVKILGVESDDNVRRLNFQMPKAYGEFDLSTFAVRVNYMNANGEVDIYEVTDNEVSGENIVFSWLVEGAALKYKGDVNFIVCLKKDFRRRRGRAGIQYNSCHTSGFGGSGSFWGYCRTESGYYRKDSGKAGCIGSRRRKWQRITRKRRQGD